jgi:hypothetical protein
MPSFRQFFHNSHVIFKRKNGRLKNRSACCKNGILPLLCSYDGSSTVEEFCCYLVFNSHEFNVTTLLASYTALLPRMFNAI